MTVIIKSHVYQVLKDYINFDYGKTSWCQKMYMT